jgi:ankyrin repeat protein
VKIAHTLLKHHADPNIFAPCETALHTAILNSDEELIRLLIRYEANVHLVDKKKNSRSPLDYAVQAGDDHVIRLLLGATGRVRKKMIKDISTNPSTPIPDRQTGWSRVEASANTIATTAA